MSDGRGGPDVPRPENDASVPSHGTTPDAGGGFTDPAPGGDGIIVQGGRTASGPQDPSRAIGPKQDDPRAIGPKQDDPRAIGPKQDDPRAIGPKQDDPRAIGPKQDDPRAIGPKQDDPRAIGPKQDDPRAIGPKQDDPRAIGPKQDDPRAIGPKQDDPRAIGPKQDDPRAVGRGIIVQGGRTGHPDKKARQKQAKKKMKTMALVIGGVMVMAVGGVFVGRQLGHDPATLQPQAAATPTAAVSGAAPAPSASTDGGSPAPAPTPTGSPTEAAASPTPAPSHPPTPGAGNPAPVPPTTPPAPPKQSGAPAPVAVPTLSLRPASVREFCANGEWPSTLVVRNSGGGNLNWSIGSLPSGVTATAGSGSLAAGASQVITLGGRTEQQPPGGRFTIGFSSNGGSGQVTVTCA
ncbi:hypothetical protein EDD96_6297 [Streptomyces sp. Ag109_G2-6]|uniref:hypothetical protein n=1 Tax=Streptomyces sp. Ag109_G2-6 TaxID=2485154 RepID=UPI000F4EE406|nr:hypothetical protein [Streptomyces sp. Ag109_G2-6]RPF29756.1 hypothetical protein EDD96_6297 [Streptomyces sp. Ag109_G2-6]